MGAGTNKSNAPKALADAPAVILVHPQLGENIGMCARAMLNCGVGELRLVKPRDGWPNPDAEAAAAGAISVLENAKVFETTADAVADLHYIVATTARGRELAKPVLMPDAAAREIRTRNTDAAAQKCGILFGAERTGLENDDIARADVILNIPLNPGFTSLNLAQAVLLVCHAWLAAENPFSLIEAGAAPPAAKADVENLLKHLEDALDSGGFFRSEDLRPTLIRNIRNYFFKSAPTEQEVRTLHGVFSSLMGKRSWK